MPDRYGDTPDEPMTYTERLAVEQCGLCDDDGVRGMRRCDHRDHASAAARGMALIRSTMGWDK